MHGLQSNIGWFLGNPTQSAYHNTYRVSSHDVKSEASFLVPLQNNIKSRLNTVTLQQDNKYGKMVIHSVHTCLAIKPQH